MVALEQQFLAQRLSETQNVESFQKSADTVLSQWEATYQETQTNLQAFEKYQTIGRKYGEVVRSKQARSYLERYHRAFELVTQKNLGWSGTSPSEMAEADQTQVTNWWEKALPILDELKDKTQQSTTQQVTFIYRLILTITVLFTLLAIILALGISQSIADAINRLKDATQRVANGELQAALVVTSSDEIGQLAAGFNSMAQRIQESQTTLQKKNIDLDQNLKKMEETKRAILNIMEDLEETKSQIEKEKAQDEAILSSIGGGVFAVDPQGKIIVFNQACAVISGYSEQEALGQHFWKIFHFVSEDKHEPVDEFIDQALEGKRGSMPLHTLLVKKDQGFVPVADSAAPIFNAEGQLEGVVVVFRDITRERQLEKLKDEFVSVASHELRTPMTAIKGMISMIFDGDYGPVSPELKEPLSDVMTSTERLIHLVNDMLNVSRIEAGRLKFELSNFSVVEPLKEVVLLLQPIAKQKGITLTTGHLDAQAVQADLDKVKQIINNVVGNSLKFTDQGSITLTTQIKEDRMVTSVEDTGLGIDPADQQKLFGKFQQITSQQEGKPAGTGLGLYISRQLAQKMGGGDLWIQKSELGKGSTFAFSLPLQDSKLAAEVRSAIQAEATAHPDQKNS
jgi:PAS domain S-box-containing protein